MAVLSGCTATGGGVAPEAGATPVLPVALLLPLSGPLAEVGASMRRAAGLAQSSASGARITLDIRDSSGDPARAAQEAAAAIAGGARMILGPVTAAEVRATVAVAGTVPVVAFSNDPALLGSGAYVFGVTPVQSVAAVLTHARNDDLASVVAVLPSGAYGDAMAEAVETLAPRAGLRLSSVLRDGAGPGVLEARIAALSPPPDAVLVGHFGAALEPVAASVRRATDAQILGTVQWLRDGPPWGEALEGAVFAVPEPKGFASFAGAYGEGPGLLAALAFDAVRLSEAVASTRAPLRNALHRSNGFRGVVGPYRFYDSGLCERELGIQTIRAGDVVRSTST